MLSTKYTRLDDQTISKIQDICEHTYKKCKPYFIKTRVALDIGAKSGHFANHIQKDFDTVHMFDMRPKWNNYTNERRLDPDKCKFHQFAIGNRNGKVTFSGPITILTGKTAKFSRNTAKLRTIDSFNFDTVDFIKIDVEGDEKNVLEGAQKTIARCKPVIVLEQNHTTEKYKKGKYGDAVRWLENNNYKIDLL